LAAAVHGVWVEVTHSTVVCIASWNADLTSRISRPLAVGETAVAHGFTVSPGGKGSNAAVAAARMGAQLAVVARVGDDAFGQMGLALWADEGIDTAHVVRAAGEASGVAQILVYDSGDNSIAVSAGANAGLSAAHVEAARVAIAGARVVVASNEVPMAVALAAFTLARAHGVATVFNPAPAVPSSAALRAMLSLCDVITPNEGELHALAASAVSSASDASAAIDDAEGQTTAPHPHDLTNAAQTVLAMGVKAIIVTLGAHGCALYRSGHAPQQFAGWPVDVADTVGAGDTLTGALAACLASGMPLERATLNANAAAALSVTGTGALGGMPSLAQVEAMLV
jgi:ribokinase